MSKIKNRKRSGFNPLSTAKRQTKKISDNKPQDGSNLVLDPATIMQMVFT